LAVKIGAVDVPNVPRKIQTEPIPYLGGVAIAIGVVITSYVALVARDFNRESILALPALF
jgi:UDP-GlcNAc:undecaprenyl-phosphate/decaprenyl-phosphate GlcNAc-1-phosphate transferase